MTKMLEGLLDLLFPPKCPFCHRVMEDGQRYLCARCQKSLPWSPGPLGMQTVEFTAGCVSPLYYREGVRDGVRRFKFQNCPGYAGAFGMLTAQAVRDAWDGEGFDVVTWAPLSQKRLRKRGYDQARLLAEEVARRLEVPARALLVKPRNNPEQSGQESDGLRRVNVMDAYEAVPGAEIAGQTVLLVDDVVTTGSTLAECARILRSAGAAKVYCAAFARARN